MTQARGLSRYDRRKIHRLHRRSRVAIRKAENHVNAAVIARMNELRHDSDFNKQLDDEVAHINNMEDARQYVARVSNCSKGV